MNNLPTLSDVEAAARRIKGHAVRTPLLYTHTLSARLGGDIWIKPEVLQRTGSFKFRGAFNKLSQFPGKDRGRGVVAWSSGNHAQGVAAAAQVLGMPATIVMPKDAPEIKIQGTKSYGAEVVFFDRYTEDREEIGLRIAARTGATIVPSYDDPDIIAGQGTIGLEILEDLLQQGLIPDEVVLPCGGGGISSGTGLALHAGAPSARLTLAEPEGYDDFARSLASGRRETADVTRKSLCDALLTPTPGQLTFALNQAHGAQAVAVSDGEVKAAMRVAFRDLKLIVEPGGAAALAALLTGKIDHQKRTVVIVLSGGNVDAALYADVMTES